MAEKITINDIAKLAGVSKTTVSFFLNGKYEKMSVETKTKIQEVIDKTNYHPNTVARLLNAKKTFLIGVIIGDITNSFANQIVKGIDGAARKKGYQMIVGSTNYDLENEKKCLRSMNDMGVDGFIVQPTTRFESLWESSGIRKPIVFFDSSNTSSKELWVKTNNYEAVFNAVESLIRQGYEHFVIVTADPYALRTRMERNKGFVDCLDLNKKPYKTIIADSETEIPVLKHRLMDAINPKESTAVFACNNWLLDKVYLILRDYKQEIPQHIGLIGFDSTNWTELATPSITTIVQPAHEEGIAAAEILIDRIEGRNEKAPNQILKCHVNWLDSTAKSRKKK